MSQLHPSHKVRFSWDASTYDFVCEVCGETDQVPGGWGKLAEPCCGTRTLADKDILPEEPIEVKYTGG